MAEMALFDNFPLFKMETELFNSVSVDKGCYHRNFLLDMVQ